MAKRPTLTTSSGIPVPDNQNSITAGPRGPLLMQDFHLPEKLAHQNRERIPERTVHAKGSGAYGTLTVTNDITKYTRAAALSKVGKTTEDISARSFEEVMDAFYNATGSIEEGFGKVANTAHSPEDFERIFKAREGSSGFMRFDVTDHGRWLATIGQEAKAVMVVLGNPLIARTMLRHNIGARLNMPVRIFVYQHRDGKTRIAYDFAVDTHE